MREFLSYRVGRLVVAKVRRAHAHAHVAADLGGSGGAGLRLRALSFMGVANVNLAKMVTDDINAHGGLPGRLVELYVEDSATDDEGAHTAAARLVREADVDVVIGGIYSSTRQAIKRWSTRPRSSTSTRSSTKVRKAIP